MVRRQARRTEVGRLQAMTAASPGAAPAIGQEAPDFTLRDQNNEAFTLSAFRGQKAVLILFYPLAFTGICTGELYAVRDDIATFQNHDVQVVTISVDSTYSHKIFSEREGYEFPLLADFWPHGAVAQMYGAFNEVTGFANRGTFLVDKDGIVRYTEMNQPGEGRDPQKWREAIKAL
jgi:mycoredoxin-dependent peroxiredoxin